MSTETQKTNVEQSFPGKVWETLKSIDCSDKVKQKGGYNYLSWSFAWSYLMDTYPESTYLILDDHQFLTNTVEVIVTVTVKEGENEFTRAMRLPVMDHRNAALVDPDARDISDARMRCMVKCLALFGLGLYLYSGEDIPRKRNVTNATDEQLAQIQEYKDANQINATTQDWINKNTPLTEKRAAGLLRRLNKENE